jgi:hypothetical protein
MSEYLDMLAEKKRLPGCPSDSKAILDALKDVLKMGLGDPVIHLSSLLLAGEKTAALH